MPCMHEWIPSFSLNEFPALQLSAPWLMFTQWLIWLFRVMVDKQQLISTISTWSLRTGRALLRKVWLRGWNAKQRAQRCRVFTASLIYALSLAEPWVMFPFLFLSLFSPSIPSCLLFPFHSYFSTYWYSSLCSYFPSFPSLAFLSTFYVLKVSQGKKMLLRPEQNLELSAAIEKGCET